MFSQLVPFIALATLLIPVPSRAVPGAAWVRRQEDAQTSLTLDPAEISVGLEQDGQGDNPDPGQVRSLTSSNNFINFCLPFLDQGVVLTNGAQVVAGSCNQTPMGRIISLDLAPRSKFVFPPNGDESIQPNTAFTVKMKLLNMQAGNFVNAATNYYAAPQQVNDQGILIGHTHFVIEPLPSLDTTEPLDPLKFAFFKGINDAVDGDNIVQTTVTAGLGAGFYRLCSINTAANHQPALVSNAQHGSLDDCSYFTIKDGGNTAFASSSASIADNASTTAAASSATETDSASASTTDSASDAASTSDAASSTDAATDAATDAPQATESPSASDDSNSDSASSTDDAATPAPDSTTSTDAAAPTDTSSTDNGNQDGNNGNNGNQGGNNGNDGNNGNNKGDNQNTPSDDSSSAPAPTDDSSSAAAPTDAAPTDAAPSDATPSDATPSDNTPTDDSSAAPAPTDAAPSDAAPSQGNDNGGGNGDNNDNQGGDSGADDSA